MGKINGEDTVEFVFALITYPVTILLVLNRIYIRIIQPWGLKGCLTNINAWTLSDIFVVFAWLFTVPRAVEVFYMFDNDVQVARYGANYKDAEKDSLALFRLRWVLDVTYFFPMYCVKAALLCFYNEILQNTSGGKRGIVYLWWIIRATGVLVFIGVWSSFFMVVFACLPVSSHWTFNDAAFSSACMPFNRLGDYLVTEILHIGTDLAVFILPFFFLRYIPTTTTKSQKLSAILMFSLGFLSIACSMLMAYTLWLNRTTEGGLWGTWDGMVHWQRYMDIYARKVEQASAICVVCMPALRRTVKGWWEKRKSGKEEGDEEKRVEKRQVSRGGTSTTNNVSKTYAEIDGDSGSVGRESVVVDSKTAIA